MAEKTPIVSLIVGDNAMRRAVLISNSFGKRIKNKEMNMVKTITDNSAN